MPLTFNPFGSKRVATSLNADEQRESLLSPEERDSNTEAGANDTATSDSSKQTSSTLSRFTSSLTSPFKTAMAAASASTESKKPEDALNPSQETEDVLTNPSQKTKDALSSACLVGNLETCKALIGKEAGADAVLDYGATALMQASRTGYKDIVEFLITKSAKLDIQDNGGNTALILACSYARNNVADILIRNNANVDLTDREGYSALHRAIINGCSEQAVGSLIEKVANVDLQCSNGEAAIHFASTYNDIEIVQKLIDKGVRLDLTTKHGKSPLHIASQQGNKDTVAILVNAGANVDLVTTDTKETPLHLACARNVDFLKDYTVTSQREDATTKERKILLETAKILIDRTVKKDGDIDAVDSKGETALFKACKNGHGDIVKALLSAGATLEGLHKEGELSSAISSKMKSLIANHISEIRSTQGISHEPGSAPKLSEVNSELLTVKLNTPPDRTPS